MELDPHTLARARLAVREALPLLLADPNIGMVDVGLRDRGGRLTDELALRCHVLRKYRGGLALESAIARGDTQVNLSDLGPIGGFPVDVIEGRYRPSSRRPRRPASPRARRHPLMRGGISISGAYGDGYGTLGGKVIDRATGQELLLSNWHVLVGEWRPRGSRPIYQPGRGDGGGPADTVAVVLRDAMAAGIDAAVAALTGARELSAEQLELGPVGGLARPALGMVVVKSGRASAVTTGMITGVEGVQLMRFGGIERMIRHVVTVDPLGGQGEVSRPGDSGAFWLERGSRAAVALHFAGGNRPERALAIEMGRVLDALGVDLAPAGESRPAAPALAAPPRRQPAPPPEPDEPRLSPRLIAAIERAGQLAEHHFGEGGDEEGDRP